MRMPTERVSPNMVMLLNVNPKARIMVKVEMTETGRAKALIKVTRKFLRKSITAKTARMPPKIR